MRSWTLVTILAAMLLFVAACSTDDDSDDTAVDVVDDTPTEVAEPTPTPEPEPEPTETPEPTPTPEPEPTPSPEPTPTPEPAEAVSPADLEALLLSLEDFPQGWTQAESDAVDDELDMDVSSEPFDNPCGIEPPDWIQEPLGEAEREFEGTELGPFVMQMVSQWSSSNDAAAVLDVFREMFDCEEWMESDEFGEEMVFTIEEVPFTGVGDDVFAIRIGLSFPDEPMMNLFGDLGFDMIIFQRNEYVSMIMFIDIFGMGEVDLESIATRADEKIQAGG